MATDLLIQGRSYGWLVDDQGRALVRIGDVGAYAVNYDQVSSTLAYLGKAVPGTLTSAAGWQIKKLVFDSSGGVITTFADGDSDYDNIWDNRASLVYS